MQHVIALKGETGISISKIKRDRRKKSLPQRVEHQILLLLYLDITFLIVTDTVNQFLRRNLIEKKALYVNEMNKVRNKYYFKKKLKTRNHLRKLSPTWNRNTISKSELSMKIF